MPKSKPGPAPTVREEIRQPRPFATERQEALMSLLRTADRVGRYLAAVLQPAGITRQQYNVLRILRGAGGNLPTMEIRERMIEEAPGITALLDRLERKALVARRQSTEDGRVFECHLTEQGRELLASLDTPMDLADAHALRGLDDGAVHTLTRLLDQARAGIPHLD